MKKLYPVVCFTILMITACILFEEKGVEVLSASLKISQSTSFDINSAQMGKQYNEASVQGEIKNVSEQTLKNIVLTYKFPRGRVTAKIGKLEPGKTRRFVTTRYQTTSRNPSFKLENVSFSKL